MGDLGVIALFAGERRDAALAGATADRRLSDAKRRRRRRWCWWRLSFALFWVLDRMGADMLGLEKLVLRRRRAFRLTADLSVHRGRARGGDRAIRRGQVHACSTRLPGSLRRCRGGCCGKAADLTRWPPGAAAVHAAVPGPEPVSAPDAWRRTWASAFRPGCSCRQDQGPRSRRRLDRVGLAGMGARRPRSLSGGQAKPGGAGAGLAAGAAGAVCWTSPSPRSARR